MGFPLPTELTCTILEYISHDDPHLAKYATISRDWPAIVESRTFSYLNIETSEQLAEFNELSWGQRGSYVRTLHLIVQLESYYDDDGDACLRYENEGEMQRNNKLFDTSTQSFFITLAKWPKEGAGFSLSIEAQSPDDILDQTPEDKRYRFGDFRDQRFERSYLQFNSEIVTIKWPAIPTDISLVIIGGHDRRQIEPASCSFVVSKLPRLYRLKLNLNDHYR